MIPAVTRDINILDTVVITYNTIKPEDCILYGINTLAGAIKNDPTAMYDEKVKDITALQDICTGWAGNDTLANLAPPV